MPSRCWVTQSSDIATGAMTWGGLEGHGGAHLGTGSNSSSMTVPRPLSKENSLRLERLLTRGNSSQMTEVPRAASNEGAIGTLLPQQQS